ncbi:glycosyl hydrolase family 61-domain-containing protein [Pyrenochaeta sp. MPI-SDFR-AT-0127]|nr:glycosyl hydrolase family 61-domain-containing protein [Pyrenochaeta sp. MPI-SDFR-AT-0127]
MKTVAVLSAITALANAHATWQQLWKNGEDLESTCARLPPSNSPIEDYTSTALQCNVNPAAASGKCGFAAGDTVTIEMHQHNDRLCTKEGIGGAHWGPVLAYLGKVEDAATADGSGEFFKIYQNGWKKNPAASQGDNDFWGTKDLNYNCGKLDFKIPEGIAPGDYLLRAEAIALHAAGAGGGAQHYVTCYQLTVTGSGTLVPKGVKFPEAYSKTGPGLGFSIHADLSDYPIPGPALIAGGSEATPQLLTFGEISGAPPAATGAASAPAAVSSTKAAVIVASSQLPASSSAVAEAEPTAAAPSSVAAPVASSAEAVPTEAPSEPAPEPEITDAAPTPTATAAPIVSSSLTPAVISAIYSAAPGPVVPTTFATSTRPKPTNAAAGSIKEFYQCGGQGFKGAATCAEGLECREWNPWYHQCVKAEATKPGPSKGPAPTSAVPSKTATAPAAPEPTVVDPTENGSTEKTYTLETFIEFLQKEAGSESAAKIRRMIEALQ